MNWAEERASEIVDQMRSERPSLTIGRQEEIIAAALQQVADECVAAAQHEVRLYQQPGDKRFVAERLEHNLRARFPKEEK